MDIVNSTTRNMHAVGNTTEPNIGYIYNAISYLFLVSWTTSIQFHPSS